MAKKRRDGDEVRESLRRKKAKHAEQNRAVIAACFADQARRALDGTGGPREWHSGWVRAAEEWAEVPPSRLPVGRLTHERYVAALVLGKATGLDAKRILEDAAKRGAEARPCLVPPIALAVRVRSTAKAGGRDGAYYGDELVELCVDGGRHDVAKRLRSLAETIAGTTGAPVQSAVVAVLLRRA